VDFALNAEQRAVIEAVERLLQQHAGPARAIALQREDGYDEALDRALAEAGFADIARDFADGERLALLEAALVVEAIARAGGVVSAAARLLVLPAVSGPSVAGPIALCTREELTAHTPLRYAAHARQLLVLDGEEARLVPVSPGDFAAVRTSFGYPMGRAVAGADCAEPEAGEALGGGCAGRLRDAWRVALAVEAVGTREAALDHTVAYLKQRRQFGRAIASFQAIQHRLSQCTIAVEASRWLAREAAWHGARTEAAATAAAFALDAADQVFSEAHQMSGAIGFTREFDLHVWSMRLLALRQELGGVGGARRAIAASRWSVPGR